MFNSAQAEQNTVTEKSEEALPSVSSLDIKMTSKKIQALLDSPQFGVIYKAPYRGDDEDVVALMGHCEKLTKAITEAPAHSPIVGVARLLDACLLVHIPSTEFRGIVMALAEKNVAIIDHMPQLRNLLTLVLRAIEISHVLNPFTLSAISRDIAERNALSGSNDV